jgi:hypothetical protein
MSAKKRHIRILSCCASILLMFCFVLPVYAADSDLKIELNNLILKSNGGDAKWETVKKNGHIVLDTNTNGLEKGYYTSEITIKNEIDWSSFGEISFYIKDLSNKPIRINIFVIQKDGTYLAIDGNGFVLLQKENYKDMNILNTQDGLFQLDNDFNGTVHVPFQNFKSHIKNLKDIMSFGITTTTEEGVDRKIEMGDFKLISPKNLSVAKEISSLQIIGDKNITKPIVGESIAQYNLIANHGQDSANKNKASFSLIGEVEGVSITSNGRLTLTTKATAKKVNIKAVINNKFNIILEVLLSDSLILNLKDAEGFSLAVPKAQEVQKVISSQDVFNRTDMLILFRVIITGAISIIITLYFIWRRRWIKEKII